MAKTEAQKRARDKYAKAHVKRVMMSLYPKDHDLYEWMQENGYTGSWLRDIARREMEREKQSLQ